MFEFEMVLVHKRFYIPFILTCLRLRTRIGFLYAINSILFLADFVFLFKNEKELIEKVFPVYV